MKKLSVMLALVLALVSVGFTATAEEPITITVAHGQGEWYYPILDKLAEGFTEKTGINVEYIAVASDSLTTWLTAQFSADTEPDVILDSGLKTSDYFGQGKILDLTPYYEAPSMITGEIWKDGFLDGALKDCYDDSGLHLIETCTAKTVVSLYYNIDLMQELGLGAEPPRTLSELWRMCDVVLEDGRYIPFSVMNSMSWNLSWVVGLYLEALYSDTDIWQQLDIISPNGGIQASEALLGLKSGLLSYTDERLIEYFDIMKQFTKYFNEDYNAVSWEYEGYFNSGKAVFNINGGWYPAQVIENEIDINYGAAEQPTIDSALSAHSVYSAEHPYIQAPGSGAGDWCVTQKAADEGRGDAAVSFLQYLTDGGSGAQLLCDLALSLPVAKGVTYPEQLKAMDVQLEEGQEYSTIHGYQNIFGISSEAQSLYWTAYTEYLDPTSTKTAEEFCQELSDMLMPLVDEAIEDNPDYKIDEYLEQLGV